MGIGILVGYAGTAGPSAHPPADWPAHAPVQLAHQKSTLLLFVHPQCPCSRSTLGELARIITAGKDQLETTVFFYFPSKDGPGWAHTDLWETAVTIPTVKVLGDSDATAARLFGARTSGQALLYDSRGNLAFNGGITALRGHYGDNDGRDAILALLRGADPEHRRTPVFGCALYGEILSKWNPAQY